jgi:hypothetical protein
VDTSSAWTVSDATTGATLGSASIDMDGSTRYTILAFPGTSSAVDLVTVSDPYDISITNDNGRVRVVNGSFNAANVDVYLTAANVDIATVAPNFAAAAYKSAVPASSSNSTDFTAGNYVMRVTTAGTKAVIFTAPIEVQTNADLLLMTVPQSIAVNDVKVLEVIADNGQPSTEIINQP